MHIHLIFTNFVNLPYQKPYSNFPTVQTAKLIHRNMLLHIVAVITIHIYSLWRCWWLESKGGRFLSTSRLSGRLLPHWSGNINTAFFTEMLTPEEIIIQETKQQYNISTHISKSMQNNYGIKLYYLWANANLDYLLFLPTYCLTERINTKYKKHQLGQLDREHNCNQPFYNHVA